MSFLKQIPVEQHVGTAKPNGRGRKSFNPVVEIKKIPLTSPISTHGNVSLKEVCMELLRYINRGERYSIEQVEKVISKLQRSVISLQKKKTELMRTKHAKHIKKKKKS